jgi:hypothetical protein
MRLMSPDVREGLLSARATYHKDFDEATEIQNYQYTPNFQNPLLVAKNFARRDDTKAADSLTVRIIIRLGSCSSIQDSSIIMAS